MYKVVKENAPYLKEGDLLEAIQLSEDAEWGVFKNVTQDIDRIGCYVNRLIEKREFITNGEATMCLCIECGRYKSYLACNFYMNSKPTTDKYHVCLDCQGDPVLNKLEKMGCLI